jgi:N6-adenosine-specific RNA methylase IME4
MTLDELVTFELPPIADDAWLLLWRVASMQDEALELVRAWGFRPVAEIVWVKTTDDGEVIRIGMGRTVRNAHEVALVCKRGRPARGAADVPSVFFAPRGRHSAKPDKFYELIERLADGPRVELFARARRPGWSCFGDELPAEMKTTMPKTTTSSAPLMRTLLGLVELVLMPPHRDDEPAFLNEKDERDQEQRRRGLLIDAFTKPTTTRRSASCRRRSRTSSPAGSPATARAPRRLPAPAPASSPSA